MQQRIVRLCLHRLRSRLQGTHYPVAQGQEPLPVIAPQPGYLRQKLNKSRLAVAAAFWKICPREKGLLLRSHDDRERPAARAVNGLAHGHIHRVDIRPLLAVYLNAHIAAVEDIRRLRVLKGLVRHNMAPVAGGIAYAQEHRLILPPGLFKRLSAPRIPVHGIIPMLPEIGRAFVFQSV